MINDISGLRDDPDLIPLIAERDVPVCIMHMRDTPRTMQRAPEYDDVVDDVRRELESFVATALAGGIDRSRIIVDPGIGFGKTFDHNWSLLRHLNALVTIGFPVLVGLSRKSFLGGAPEERLDATIAAQLWCTLQGVSILRVHDVAPMMASLAVLEAIGTAR